MEYKKEFHESIKPEDSIKAKQKRFGFKRPLKEILKGWFVSFDITKFPFGVYKERVIDREKKRYSETVINKKTKEIVRDVKEDLDKHNTNNIEKDANFRTGSR